MKPKSSNKKIGVSVAVVAVIVVLAVVVYGQNSSTPASNTPVGAHQVSDVSTNTTPAETQTPTTPDTGVVQVAPADPSTKSTSVYSYKNGTYTATGSYMSPGGMDKLGVTITLANDVVTDVSVTPMAGDRTSSRYQQIFADNYKQYVVGQKISNLHLGKVSRSSLTPEGFNDALSKIKAQAQA